MDFLKRNHVGLVLRAYASRTDLVEYVVQQTMETINTAMSLGVDEEDVFSKIDVVVVADGRYPDHDCGETVLGLLEAVFVDHPHQEIIRVTQVNEGDLFGGVLRQAFFQQIRAGMDYTMNLSSGVVSYLTHENMVAMLKALENGARATGLALNEFADSIMEGRILDTCAIWHLESWMRAGGYSVRGDQPMLKDRVGWVRGAEGESGIDGEWFYVSAGVEEMYPLINMVKLFGPCIAPIRPKGDGKWIIPADPKVRAREMRKIATKHERQVRAAYDEGVTLSFLKGGVLPEYRSW